MVYLRGNKTLYKGFITMKKIPIISILILVFIGAIAYGAGLIAKPIIVGCTTTEWTAVTGEVGTTSIVVKAEDSIAIKISDTSDGAKYFTIPSGSALTYSFPSPLYPDGETMFWAQTLVDDGSILVLPQKGER